MMESIGSAEPSANATLRPCNSRTSGLMRI